MKNAIQKAIEGGYKWEYVSRGHTIFKGQAEDYSVACDATHLLDPLFWQYLGKTLGWTQSKFNIDNGANNRIYYNFGNHTDELVVRMEAWMFYWHNFIDHIADGGDVDEFFNNLINK